MARKKIVKINHDKIQINNQIMQKTLWESVLKYITDKINIKQTEKINPFKLLMI